MTTRKMLIIEQCKQCHYLSEDNVDCYYFEEGPRQIPNKFSIPTWCELSDVSQPTVEEGRTKACEDCGQKESLCRCHIPQDLEQHFSSL